MRRENGNSSQRNGVPSGVPTNKLVNTVGVEAKVGCFLDGMLHRATEWPLRNSVVIIFIALLRNGGLKEKARAWYNIQY